MENGQLKVVCYSIPMMGHALPVLSLARALAQRGHQVVYATSRAMQMEALCSKAGVSFRGLEDGYTAEGLKTIDDPTGPVFQEYYEKHVALVSKVVQAESPDLILSDLASGAGFVAAQEARKPLVINVALPGHLVQRMRLLRIPFLHYLVEAVERRERHVMRFFSMLSLPAAESTLTIINSCEALDGPLALPKNYFCSGPLDSLEKREISSEHSELLSFLSKAKARQMPVVYITTGSLMMLTGQQVKAIYEGFAACDVWVIWSLKKDKQAYLPELPERFYVSAWMPQAEILQLPELLCVLTHCGWGGTLEAMLNGKPVICYPGFGDQGENARLLHGLGCGPLLAPLTCTAMDVQQAVEDVLAKREAYGRRAREVGQGLRDAPGPQKTAVVIEEAVLDDMAKLAPKPWHLQNPAGCQIS